jgi:hypothetical protein
VLLHESGLPILHDHEDNRVILAKLAACQFAPCRVVFERVSNMGQGAGRSTFETVFWTGRFFQAAVPNHETVGRITRVEVKRHLLGTTKGKDGDIRRALLQRFGYSVESKRITTGPLVGISAHKWQALAVGVTWWDRASSSGALNVAGAGAAGGS